MRSRLQGEQPAPRATPPSVRKDPPFDLSLDRQQDLRREWETTLNVYRAFQGLEARRRFHHLGLLFERLLPWLERSIRSVVLQHFLVLPTETLVARLFARAARLEVLPESHEAFLIWVEAQILQDLADPAGRQGLVGGAQNEPSPELQRRFNALSFGDRALLFLYLVEGLSLARLAAHTGVPVPTAVRSLKRSWRQIGSGRPPFVLPEGWRRPERSILATEDLAGEE